jgi:hypothetical protein
MAGVVTAVIRSSARVRSLNCRRDIALANPNGDLIDSYLN